MEVEIRMFIRTMRIIQGITLRELSSKVGISISDLSLIERGLQMPRLDTMVKIALALGVSMEQLFSVKRN